MQFAKWIVAVTLAEAARGRVVQASEASEAGSPLLSQLLPLVRADAAQGPGSKALQRAEVLSPAPVQRVLDFRGGKGKAAPVQEASLDMEEELEDLEDALQAMSDDALEAPQLGAPLDAATKQMQEMRAMLDDPMKMQAALQEMEAAMEQMLQDPEKVKETLQANPMIQEMAKTNPEVAEMLQDATKFQEFAQKTVKQMEETRAAMQQMQAIMDDPETAEKSIARIEEAVAEMQADPSRMQEMLQANPMIQQLAEQDPQVKAMLEDPDQVEQLGQMLTSQLEMLQKLLRAKSSFAELA